MNQALKKVHLPPHAVRVAGVDQWSRILDPEINLVLMPRDLGPGFRTSVAESRWPSHFQIQGDSGHRESRATGAWARDLAFLKPRLRNDLIADIFWLMDGFARLGDGPFRYSLMTITDVMCPAFHADSYGYRLITTYRGPGTEWVDNENVNWPNISDRNYDARIRDPEKIRSFPTQTVALMQGESPHARVPGLVHRSPTPARGAAPRIVLRMDYP